MSVIVAIKHEGKIYIGADSQVTKGGSRKSLSNPNNYKVWKVKNAEHCLMGHVGSLRDACVLRCEPNFIREIDQVHDVFGFEYVVERIEPMIKNILADRDFVRKEDPYGTMDSRFLFAHKDRLFTIEYGSVIEHDDFVAIGSGESEAVGSLLSTEDIKDQKERIIKAIKATAAHDIYVDYPIIMTDTDKCKFDVLTEVDIKELENKKNNKKKISKTIKSVTKQEQLTNEK